MWTISPGQVTSIEDDHLLQVMLIPGKDFLACVYKDGSLVVVGEPKDSLAQAIREVHRIFLTIKSRPNTPISIPNPIPIQIPILSSEEITHANH